MDYINQTKKWIETFVIGMNFCPFAKLPFETNRIHYEVITSSGMEKIGQEIVDAMHQLCNSSVAEIETTLLIFPNAFSDFLDYLNFVDAAQVLLEDLQLEGILQLATFHPAYQFEGTVYDAPENYTNRSPYPMLHLLRESSVSWAVTTHPDVENIPNQNIARLQALGITSIKKLWNEYSGTA